MRLAFRFHRLPLTFDAARLEAEVAGIAPGAWTPHPAGYAGNSALVLVSPGGTINDGPAAAGPMRPTPWLGQLPYVRQVIAALDVPVSRTRLMRIDGQRDVPEHRDVNYHWFRRTRLHIPILTHPAVAFSCGGETVHMAAGEAWTFDNFEPHGVTNPADAPRIHLVVDTPGTPAFWAGVRQAREDGGAPACRFVPYRPGVDPAIPFEPHRFDVVTPDEFAALADQILDDVLTPEDQAALRRPLLLLQLAWRATFDEHGLDATATPAYARVIQGLRAQTGRVPLGTHGEDARSILTTMLPDR